MLGGNLPKIHSPLGGRQGYVGFHLLKTPRWPSSSDIVEGSKEHTGFNACVVIQKTSMQRRIQGAELVGQELEKIYLHIFLT